MFGSDTNDRPRDDNGSGHISLFTGQRITFDHNGNAPHSEEFPSGPNYTVSSPDYPGTHHHNEYSTLNDPLVRTSSRPTAAQPPSPQLPKTVRDTRADI